MTSKRGSCKGEFLIGGKGDEKDKGSWTCPVYTAKNKKSINCDSSCAQYEGVPTSFSGSLEF